MNTLMSGRKFYADSRANISLPGQPPVFGRSSRPLVSLALLTSVRPGVRKNVRRFEETLERHLIFKEQALSNPNVHEVRMKGDLFSHTSESMGILFGLQHAPEGLTRERVYELSRAGIISGVLAHDESNEYGGGFRSESSLTNRGAALVRWYGECGIILDLSHAGQSTAMGAIAVIKKEGLPTKVMASHSGCHATYHHPRNLIGVMIREINNMEGYIGIPAITYLIAEKDGLYLDRFVQHVIDTIKVCGGSGIVGIGSSCNHFDMSQEDARSHFWNIVKPKGTEDCGEYFPHRPPELIEQGSRMFEIFEQRLLKRYDQAVVDDLCGLNFRKFLFRALPRT